MIFRLFHALTDPSSFWREVLRYGFLAKKKTPQDWFIFRHDVAKMCAIRREPHGGPSKELVEEVFPDIYKVESRVKLTRPNAYNLSWEEVVTISHLVCMTSPRTLFEFGTFDGRTTLHLALNAPDDAIVYTIDKGKGEFDFGADTPFFKNIRIGECFLTSPVRNKIQMLTGDSKEFDLTQFKRSVDFVFIDADHSYDGVMHDTEKAFDMIRPGGVIVWHDYLVIGDVTKAIMDICKSKALKNLKGTSLVTWQMPSTS